MSEYTQEHRRISIETPLGKDVLLLAGFSGHEGLSDPFHFHLDLLSTDDAIKPEDIVGKNVSFRSELLDESDRWFNGYVSRFSYLGTDDRLSHYDAEVVPWLWFLDRTADCKIFQNKSVVQIIEEVFGDHGIAQFDTGDVIGSHPEREYCVQYRETDFAFVSRLMEEEGIFYRFEHDQSQHKMLLADHKGAYEKCPEKEVDFRTPITARDFDEMIMSWEHRYEYRSGKVTHTDYNFKTPTAPMEADSPTVLGLERIDSYEVFDYPGEYTAKGDGQDLAKIRMEEEEAPHEIVEARSRCRTYFAGGTFTIKQHHASSEEGKEYAITSVSHTASAHHAYEVGGEEAPLEYSNEFLCIPADVQFRPMRTTPRPVVRGMQTAVVVGPGGEEIYTDEYGRVKVQFHWDRYGTKDENSSCWIRVAQMIAGRRWGFSCWPRIGQEVVVSFLEGDPDQPLIVGCVYNDDQMPPYQGEGPDDKHADDNRVTGLKSNSTKGGEGYNEFRFDDNAGKEQIFLHAQNNMDTRVKADSMENVDGSRHLTVGGSQNEQVGGSKNLTVKADHVEKIDANMQLLVGANQDIIITADKAELIKGNNHGVINGNRNEKIDGNALLHVVGNQARKVDQKYALDATQEIYLKSDMKIVIEAMQEITIKQGANFIKLDAAGVTIFGAPMTLINSGGAAGQGTAATLQDPTEAKEAEPAEPAAADDSKTGSKSA